MRRAGLSLRHQTLFCPKLPTDIKQKTVVEHSFKKCCIASPLEDAKGQVMWANADSDVRSDLEELGSEYEVIVIT